MIWWLPIAQFISICVLLWAAWVLRKVIKASKLATEELTKERQRFRELVEKITQGKATLMIGELRRMDQPDLDPKSNIH